MNLVMALALSFSPRVGMRVEVAGKRIGKVLKYFIILIIFLFELFCNWFYSIQSWAVTTINWVIRKKFKTRAHDEMYLLTLDLKHRRRTIFRQNIPEIKKNEERNCWHRRTYYIISRNRDEKSRNLLE